MRPLLLSCSCGSVLWPQQKFPCQDEHSCERGQTPGFNTPPTPLPPKPAYLTPQTHWILPALDNLACWKRQLLFTSIFLSFQVHPKSETLTLNAKLCWFCSMFCKCPLENTAQTEGNVTAELKISSWLLKLPFFLQGRKNTFPEQALLVWMYLINSTISFAQGWNYSWEFKDTRKKVQTDPHGSI